MATSSTLILLIATTLIAAFTFDVRAGTIQTTDVTEFPLTTEEDVTTEDDVVSMTTPSPATTTTDKNDKQGNGGVIAAVVVVVLILVVIVIAVVLAIKFRDRLGSYLKCCKKTEASLPPSKLDVDQPTPQIVDHGSHRDGHNPSIKVKYGQESQQELLQNASFNKSDKSLQNKYETSIDETEQRDDIYDTPKPEENQHIKPEFSVNGSESEDDDIYKVPESNEPVTDDLYKVPTSSHSSYNKVVKNTGFTSDDSTADDIYKVPESIQPVPNSEHGTHAYNLDINHQKGAVDDTANKKESVVFDDIYDFPQSNQSVTPEGSYDATYDAPRQGSHERYGSPADGGIMDDIYDMPKPSQQTQAHGMDEGVMDDIYDMPKPSQTQAHGMDEGVMDDIYDMPKPTQTNQADPHGMNKDPSYSNLPKAKTRPTATNQIKSVGNQQKVKEDPPYGNIGAYENLKKDPSYGNFQTVQDYKYSNGGHT